MRRVFKVIQTIAAQVAHLTVFQRTATYAIPMRNPRYDAARMAELRQRYPAMKERVHNTFTGNDYDTGSVLFNDLTPAEREARLWEYWRDGVLLREAWARDRVRAWLGLQVHGFPNMFMIMAPLSPAAAFCNVPTCSQQQADWISNCIAYTRDQGRKSIEPSAQAEAAWGEHHDELANATLVPNTKSWYMGTNIAGQPRRLLAYVGGANTYRYACDKVAADGYQECIFA